MRCDVCGQLIHLETLDDSFGVLAGASVWEHDVPLSRHREGHHDATLVSPWNSLLYHAVERPPKSGDA